MRCQMVISVLCECGVVVTATVVQMRKAESTTSSDRRRVYATGASRIRNAKDPSAFRFLSFTCDAAPVIHIITTTHLFPSTSLDGAVCLARWQLKT